MILKNVKNRENNKNIKIDWEVIRNSFDSLNRMIENNWDYSLEQKKRILNERANNLSKESKSLKSDEIIIEVIEFLLANEKYGIETSFVKEVLPLKNLTPLPLAPQFLLGITSVRGAILPVFDLKKFFDLPDKSLTDFNKLIIIHSDEIDIGILADSIIDIAIIDESEIQTTLPVLSGIQADFLKGITKNYLIVLDCYKILHDKRIIVHDEL
ncbi:MAG: chemotaxis protein CheW [Bacteroidetes bacterium]|nr:chemotaxis protein CheW [Bacteroidota bacterium]